MPVLSRKLQEAVVVGGSDGNEHLLKVIVLENRSGRVKLRFEVNAGIPVHRGEIWERIQSNGSPGNGSGKTD
jgi:carbon storage regulator CsrA